MPPPKRTRSYGSSFNPPVNSIYASTAGASGYPATPAAQQASQAPKVQCTIKWNSAIGAYEVNTPYQPNFVEFIKAKIPGAERAWIPSSKTWVVQDRWLVVIVTLASELWGANAVDVVSRASVEDAEKELAAQQRLVILAALPERERAIFEFVELLPRTALQAAYRKAALDLHPDRNEGDGEQMSKLNVAWNAVEKLFQ